MIQDMGINPDFLRQAEMHDLLGHQYHKLSIAVCYALFLTKGKILSSSRNV
jgi:hypothetical protein